MFDFTYAINVSEFSKFYYCDYSRQNSNEHIKPFPCWCLKPYMTGLHFAFSGSDIKQASYTTKISNGKIAIVQ